jgi:adenosylcobinamide-phosphate synthase
MNFLIDHALIMLIALLIDLTVGDPSENRERYYPIVWISRLMYFFDRRTTRGDPRREKLLGILYPLIILFLFTLPCFLLLLFIPSDLLYIGIGALIFKMTFTISGLERYGRAVVAAPAIEAKRAAVRKIVGREVDGLDRDLLNSAAIESVAENLTDSVIAPFFYFLLFGIGGAMAYRVINTLDAVVGYKTARYLHFGWFSARTDHLLNYIPERIAAALILLTGRLEKGGLSKMANAASNAQVTIAAMSHVLRVRLEKQGYYVAGEQYPGATEERIAAAIRVMKRVALLFAALAIGLLVLLYLLSLSRFTIFTAASTALLA